MTWTAIVIVVCALLTIVLVTMEYRRPNRLRLVLRLLTVVIMGIALACIALPLTYSNKTITGIKDGILITRGFNKDSISAYQASKLFTTDAAIQKANPKLKITLVSDLGDFPSGDYSVASLHVLGYGLNGDQISQLNHFPIHFHPANAPFGITSISWNHQVKAGESLQIQGKTIGPKTAIILKGLNTTVDSITTRTKSNHSENPANSDPNFQLKTTPKNTGKAAYNLIVLNGKDTIDHETIPFEVEAAKPLKVLMLSTSPDFETRFLKNWLAQHGYAVAVRTLISKNKFSTEYFNTSQIAIEPVTSSLLDKFDLVLGDLSSFKLLSPAENEAIRQQMNQKSLGVIVKADSSAKGTSFLANSFSMDKLSDKNQKALSLIIAGQTAPSAKLMLDATFIRPQPNTQPLVIDEQNHIVASSTIYGSGKIVFTTLSNTFNWVLSGNQDDYNSLWSILIDKAARKVTVTQKWGSSTLAVQNQAVTLTVDGPVSLPVAKANQSSIAFKQNPALAFRWEATYWPLNYGWQQVTQSNLPVYWWYAFKADDWQTLHATESIAATQRYINQNPLKAGQLNQQENVVNVPVSKIYFYILLLLACTYLWVERKL